MAVTLNKANLVLKDANGNIGKIEQLSDSDLTKIRTAVSDVALVVNQSNHTPIEATTTNKGVVQLATPADVVSGASDKVVTAEQLHNSTTGTSALATENLARIDAVVTEAGISVDHTNTNQLKTAVTTLISNAAPATATANNLGVVKPDNDTITIDSNGVLTATKATQDSAGNVITDTYVKKTGDETISGIKTFTGTVNANGFIGFNSTRAGTGSGFANYLNNNRVCDVWGQPRAGVDANTSYIHLRVIDYGTDDNLAYLQISGNHQTKQGYITFNDKNLVRSVNGVNADANGNVQLGNVGVGAITGEIKWFAFNTVPDGYLVCNGAAVSRKTYAYLFAAIGTSFGEGDGSTTFTLPNLIDKFAQGSATIGTVKSAGLPNITGGMLAFSSGSGAFGAGELYGYSAVESAGHGIAYVNFYASRSSSLYGASNTVQPPALTLLPCIKY